MMLGWGLRGFIGGGPLGAMIPGAMVALTLAILYRRKDVALIAAFGAVAIGFGGEETYGQTVGFSVKAESFWWGVSGLALKGAMWGLLGGGAFGMVFARGLTLRILAIGGVVVTGAAFVGWSVVNHPKLIYFSNRYDRPREEVWAGFILAGFALLLWLGWNRLREPAFRFALFGTLGGGLGFGLGGAIQGLGRIYSPELTLPWWKYMEFTFGLLFGIGLAWAARELPAEEDQPSGEARVGFVYEIATAVVLTAATIWLYRHLPGRFPYLMIGCVLFCVAYRYRWAAWHIGLTITFAAAALDSARHWTEHGLGSAVAAYVVAIGVSVLFGLAVLSRVRTAELAFHVLTWSCVLTALVKFSMGEGLFSQVSILFVVMAVACSWMVSRYTQVERISHPAIALEHQRTSR